MRAKNRILFTLTSHDRPGPHDRKTGYHFFEMLRPYYCLSDKGVQIDIVSIKGGAPPADPASITPANDEDRKLLNRFKNDKQLKARLSNTLSIHSVSIIPYEGIFLVGGYGALWDFPEDHALKELLKEAHEKRKIIATTSHGAAGLLNVRDKKNLPLLKGRVITAFSNEEEKESGNGTSIPFLIENKLKEHNVEFRKEMPFHPCFVQDKHLLSGQNSESSALVADGMLRILRRTQDKLKVA